MSTWDWASWRQATPFGSYVMGPALVGVMVGRFNEGRTSEMPHDKNGTLLQEGDGVAFADLMGRHGVGTVSALYPSAESCNAVVASVGLGGVDRTTVNARDCEVLVRQGARVVWTPPPASAASDEESEPGRLAGR